MSVSLIEEPIKTFLEKIQEHLVPKNKKTYLKKPFGESEHAARVILRFFRAYLIKKKLNENPYGYYLSCIDSHEQTRFLSEMMFGMRQAPLDVRSLEYISNPFMDIFSGYHRTNNRHEGPLMQMLLSEFKVVSDWYHYIPISHSINTPFSDYFYAIKDKFPQLSNPVQWITSDKHNISILALSRQIGYVAINRIRADISACGFVATLWEMAQNIKKTDTTSNLHFLEKSEMPMWLPTCHEGLLSSAIMGRLRMIAHDPNIVSQKLAQALLRLLKNTPQLSMQAIQRVSMMLEITNLFYANNYPKYAFCVYTVVHEISLALIQERSMPRIRKAYGEFLRESKQTFCNALEIEKTGLNTFAAPATSGSNAYMLAIKFAHQLLERTPTFKVVMTSYYEFENITPKSQQADDETDVFIISTGPILDDHGLVPGVDINLFIETHLGASRAIPATIIIDTTTTLYRNLRLDEKARELISTGKLSIIIHESRQKFGLLHTDQAQYGRIFGVCSPLCYKKESLKAIEEKGLIDFMSHIDMRVGAFLSVQCSDILEDIKLQHFKNGSLMRSLLTHAIEVSDVIEHPLMSGGFDELYFLSFSDDYAEILWHETDEIVENRSSFGHFHTVRSRFANQVRFSADASDVIDTLIKSTQIFIGFFYSLKCLVPILIQYSRLLPDSLTLAQQICFLAMLGNISLTMTERGFKQADMVKLYAAMANMIDKCQDLKARTYTSNVAQYLGIFRQAILDRLEIVYCSQTFINKLRLIYLINPSLINDKMLSLLKNKVRYSYYSQPLILYKKTNDACDIGRINQPLSSLITGDLWHLLVKCKLYFLPENFPILLDPKIYAWLWPDSDKELQSNPLTQMVSF